MLSIELLAHHHKNDVKCEGEVLLTDIYLNDDKVKSFDGSDCMDHANIYAESACQVAVRFGHSNEFCLKRIADIS